MKDRLKTTFGSRLAIAITAVIVTATMVGGSVAVAQATIGSREIRNNSVTSRDIRNNSIKSADIRNNSIKVDDINGDVFDAIMNQMPVQEPPLWAKISDGNGTPTVRSQSFTPDNGGVTGVTRPGIGVYIVELSTDIRQCGWIATVNDNDAGAVSYRGIGIERTSPGDPQSLLVRTFDAAGAPANLQSDDAFTLHILCEGAK